MRPNLFFNEPLAMHTSWHIGGPARQYFCPIDTLDLSQFLQTLDKDEQIFWLGLGSNVLIRDNGFPGTVIHTLKMPSKITLLEQTNDGIIINVAAGVPCAKIAKFAAKHNVVGAEFFAGIPGTMGGALAMNAGAFGGETWPHVVSVDVIDRAGVITRRTPLEYKISYREAIGPKTEEWFLGAQLYFKLGDQEQALLRIKELLKRRSETQPIGLPSCGSVFRNPPGKYAAELIEASKLKGVRIGNAEVSNKHANFIINLGGALAKDVEQLIALVQQTVWQDHAVALCPEVKFIGI